MTAKTDYARVLERQLLDWAVSYGCVTALVVAGWVVPYLWMPLVGLGLILLVSFYQKRSIADASTHCSMLTEFTIYTLLASTLVMLAINLTNTHWISASTIKDGNPNIPFISTLIVYSCATVIYGLSALLRGKTAGCRVCHQNAGYTLCETLEHNVFHHEAKALLRMAFYTSLVLCVVSLLYYKFFYINVNINSPDTFMFFIVPAVTYVLSLFFLAQKYSSMKFEINMNTAGSGSEHDTMLRYIVLRDDRVLLEMMTVDEQKTGLWDTPAVIQIPYTRDVDDLTAASLLEKRAGKLDIQIRRLFTTTTRMHNAFHFAIVLRSTPESDNDPLKDNKFLHGEWFNIYEIDSMLKSGLVTRPFAYEIHRIYTMTMAWKTYDLNGKRLYPIKNYRPTFRLSDFMDWTLDYSDQRWLAIAQDNEDKPFFRLKKLWRRCMRGVQK